jgi:hypothetical protein
MTAAREIHYGISDQTFGPYRNLTELRLRHICAALGLDVSNTVTSYSDVGESYWAAGYISAISGYGLHERISQRKFPP